MLLPLIALASVVAQPAIAPLQLSEPLRDKNLYACSRLQAHPRVLALLRKDTVLAGIQDRRRQAFRDVADQLKLGNSHGLDRLLWTPKELEDVERELVRLTSQHSELSAFVQSEIRRPHAYQRFESLSDGELLAKAWEVSANGINQMIEVYGAQTKKGPSPEINGPIYRSNDPLFGGLLYNVLSAIQEVPERSFFDWSASLAVELLRAQARDEAGRYEPLEAGENAKATRRMRQIRWADYRYSAILVPGYGPEEAQVPFSPIGRLGCELGVRRWRAGLAPFIITSGGHAHPDRTPYCEALQMKHCLMSDFGVPESAILVDPHARHTTTNIRNAVRILARGGVPVQIPILVVTNSYQAADIASPAFANRCQGVFGYLPYQNAKRLSNFEVSLLPDLRSLTLDPQDPLDP